MSTVEGPLDDRDSSSSEPPENLEPLDEEQDGSSDDAEDGNNSSADYRDSVIRHLLGGDSDNPLTEDTVPIAMLRPLLDGLVSELSRHEKNCRHAPAMLRPLAHMQVKALRREPATKAIWKALWTEREHPFVQGVIDGWLEFAEELADDCVSGAVYEEEPLEELLSVGDPSNNIAALASTLWGLGLDDPRRARLFQLLLLLHGRDRPTSAAPAKSADAASDAVKKLRNEVRELRAQVIKSEQQEKLLEGRLRRAEKDSVTHKSEADQRQVAYEVASRDREAAQSDLAEAGRRARSLADEKERFGKQVDRWRRRTDRLQEELAELQSGLSTATKRESTMTSELASVRRDLAELEQRFADLPTPEETVMRFIRDQEERIDLDLATREGGAKREAEQRHAALMKLERAFLDFQPEFRAPRPLPLIHKGPIRYWGLGGGDEVGASSYLIEIAGRRILVDCGIRVGKDLEELAPDLGGLAGIDAMVITHAHTDHLGWLPAVVRNFGHFDVYTSPETQDLIPVMLNDSLQQLTRLLVFRREKERHSGVAMDDLVKDPYERKDKDNALLRLWPLNWGQEIGLRGDLKITLFPAGHILGAAAVLIEGDGRKVVVSGDFATFSQRTVVGATWPEEMVRPDLLLMESTYGGDNHPSRDGQEGRLVERVSRLVKAGGVALIPCFALGRAQEVLSILEAAMESGAIDRFTVWIDGMIQKINAVYRSHGRLSLGLNFREVTTGGWTREEVIASALQEPCAIVTTSGMLAGGPGVEYAKRLLDNSNNRLFFVGYLDEESPGRKLMHLGSARPEDRHVDIVDEYGETQRIRAAVPAEKVQLSAHSDRQGLIETMRTLAPNHTVLVHGETSARESLAARLTEDGFSVDSGGLRFELET